MTLPGAPLDRVVPAKKRLRTGVGAVVVLGLVALAAAILLGSGLGAHGSATLVEAGSAESESAESESALTGAAGSAGGSGIFVHLAGEVARPGLYELREGDRAVDVLAAAGGFTEAADRAAVNLARPLVDGEQIVVPVIGAEPVTPQSGAPGVSGGLVSLNTADEIALDTLPGVGPATARAILEWREKHGRFASVDDLASVPGIGPKTVDRLRDLVTP